MRGLAKGLVVFILGAGPAFPDDEEGFVSLFDPDRLADWAQCGPGTFKVEGGVATGSGGMGLWYYRKKTYTNFTLRGEFRQEERSDSGIFLRFPDPGNDPWIAVKQGHEVEIGDATKPSFKSTGSIYAFQGPTELPLNPAGAWNAYEVTCSGKRYQVSLNGKAVTDYLDAAGRPLSGYVGIQNYPYPGAVHHRRVRVKELP